MQTRNWQCSKCKKELATSLYDTVWIMPDKKEKTVSGVVGAYCRECNKFYHDTDLRMLHNLENAKFKGAIENDVAYRKRTDKR